MQSFLRVASMALVVLAFGLALLLALPGAADTTSWWAESVEVPVVPESVAPEGAVAGGTSTVVPGGAATDAPPPTATVSGAAGAAAAAVDTEAPTGSGVAGPPVIELPALLLTEPEAAPGASPQSESELAAAVAAPPPAEPGPAATPVAAPPAATTRAGDAHVAKLDFNTATFEQLLALPGIGPHKAHGILELRRRLPIRHPEDLLRVKGIGRRTLERLRPLMGGPEALGPGPR